MLYIKMFVDMWIMGIEIFDLAEEKSRCSKDGETDSKSGRCMCPVLFYISVHDCMSADKERRYPVCRSSWKVWIRLYKAGYLSDEKQVIRGRRTVLQ